MEMPNAKQRNGSASAIFPEPAAEGKVVCWGQSRGAMVVLGL